MPRNVRLHISPLTPDLLPKLIPASVLPSVSNISYHNIETFPERAYGYVEMPANEAEKLKKKLNGSILRGAKVKVEEARERRTRSKDKNGTPEAVEEEDTEAKPAKKGKKRKREEGVLPGFELPEHRRVKRGWTEPAAPDKGKKVKGSKNKKAAKSGEKREKREKSAYTDKEECLFKTKLPANVTSSTSDPTTGDKKKRKNRKNASETVVHEFENTTKYPAFLRSGNEAATSKPVAEYDESKGWIDKEGKVVEPAHKPNTRASASMKASNLLAAHADVNEPTGMGSRMGSLSLQEQEDEIEDEKASDDDDDDDDETSSSGSSSPSESASASESESSNASAHSDTAPHTTEPAPTPSEPATSTPHPLETIFKKPALTTPLSTHPKPSLEVTPVPFSFFSDSKDANDVETPASSSTTASKTSRRLGRPPNLTIPQTPFTARDQQWRAQRSAAPTPDTAAPNRSGFGNVWAGMNREDDIGEEEEEGVAAASVEKDASDVTSDEDDDDDDRDDDDDEEDEPATQDTPSASASKSKSNSKTRSQTQSHAASGVGDATSKDTDKPESEFASWFWENRGENNRAWKQRRKEAVKEKRKMEKKPRLGL